MYKELKSKLEDAIGVVHENIENSEEIMTFEQFINKSKYIIL
jgi:hypothetical protein